MPITVHRKDDLVPLEETKILEREWGLVFTLELHDNGAVASQLQTAVASYIFNVMKRMYGLENPFVYEGVYGNGAGRQEITVRVNKKLWDRYSPEQKAWAMAQIRRYSRLNKLEIEEVDYTNDQMAMTMHELGW